ncbi:MAG: endonuclease/exonuclease/phosphatase family protein [Pseudobutyrivibrio sp.]|nr:endonuclease/exonuclease/phosphatase family protein [Pseudobutyrivibrio sp.]
MVKKIIKAILAILIALIVIIVGYFAYVLTAYYRIEDNLSLEVIGDGLTDVINTNDSYRISSANLGFGAYSADYSFFMDGGTESWAYSKDAVFENITGSTNAITTLNPDIMLFQEVDLDSTRSYHVNEQDLISNVLNQNGFPDTSTSFAINYDSPFLMYPLTQPHGKSKAGEYTVSTFTIQNSIRRSLPIEEGFSKLIDLDRCYSKNYIDVSNGKQLVVYNVHLSAYTTDPSTAENQVIMLNEDMAEEFAKGNYIIAGGDMNKDVLGDSSEYFGASDSADNWAQPFPVDLLDDDFTVVGPIDKSNPVPSCRNADIPYSEDSFVLTIDGFIVSSNITVEESKVLDTQFAYSDHNPIYMDFVLNE